MAADMETCTVRYHSRSESVQFEAPTIMAPPREEKWRPQHWLRPFSTWMSAVVKVTSSVGGRLLSAPFAYLFPPSEEADSPDDEGEEKAVNTSQHFFPEDDEDESQLQRDFALTKRILGRGRNGTVYVALDRNNSEEVAVKEIKWRGEEEKQKIMEEIRHMDKLQHPRIVRYLAYQLSEDQDTVPSPIWHGTYRIFMEQMLPMSNLLQSPLGSAMKGNEEWIAFWAQNILEGLEFIHSRGLIHRDIKGDNVLVDPSTGYAKIADFGCCVAAPCLEANVGTAPYMAPEVIDPSDEGYDSRADIWSFASTVLEMVTGRQPFMDRLEPLQIIFQVGNGRGNFHPPLPCSLSNEAKDFVNGCFVHESQRPKAAELLNHIFLHPT